jgi:hypothetical protein
MLPRRKGQCARFGSTSRLENKGHDPLFAMSDESQARCNIMRGRDETWTGVKRDLMTLLT